jgi:hypothetical protein
MTVARSAQYRGCYIGIGRSGQIERVYESCDRGTTTLHGDHGTHSVLNGRQARSELTIVFGLRHAKYISDWEFGGENEKRIIAELEGKITNKNDAP